MKASTLLDAADLIRSLVSVEHDIDALNKSTSGISARTASDGLKYKPSKEVYMEFLVDRRRTITGILKSMGVNVNE